MSGAARTKVTSKSKVRALRGMTIAPRLTRRGARSMIRSWTSNPGGSGVGSESGLLDCDVILKHATGHFVPSLWLNSITHGYLEPLPALRHETRRDRNGVLRIIESGQRRAVD